MYMAPEVFYDREEGRLSDIWSLGAVFIEMLVGNKPWPGCIPREEAHKKREFFQRFAEG